jgi:hypothetical protein
VVTPVMNAIFAATGKPVRSSPHKHVKLVERPRLEALSSAGTPGYRAPVVFAV